ncbi:ABC transporter substrate-binding protein [Pelagimonas varians]|uniref:Periplasmic dipeptide transport protein n=1 Tax=Pelagimonas varians TaxID=696760 RepID=A0A238L163_9RHOB|nr:ABC transporter substrate-binding protein [Pelagimonas varians]PYG26820.1 peptide/nickel transport system substrate-binding protein [Pelagimonas varians]SMX48825.1 Periplasmic dipeptide transport protein precursor [Pelagimonas varians]
MTRKTHLFVASALASAVAFGAQAQDNSVTVVLSEELEIVEPCSSTKSNVGRVLFQNISETVTEMDPKTGLEPRLAESWEDMGNGTWRFSLRQGVTFSDGTVMDAEDVAHSLVRMKSPDIACEIGAKFFGGIDITSNIIDAHTIDVTADPAQPILPMLMSTVTVTPQDAPLDSFVDHPIGTGPYTFDEYVRGQSITLSANPTYWGEQPTVQSATYVFRSDSAVRAAMVAAGEADIAPNIALQDAVNPAMDFSYPNSETVFLRIEHAQAPLNDRRVREALNLAVDREAFVGTILADGTLLATGITPPSTIGYDADLKPYAYDPDRARALLEEARADGVPVDTNITLIGRTNNFANVLETMEALLAMYQEIGFTMTLEMVEVAEWLERYAKPFPENRGPQLIEAQHDNANGDPVFSMYFKYHSEGQQSGLTDPKVDAMIAEATAATGDERAAKWSALFGYLHEESIADVMLFHMVGFSRVNERLDFAPSIRTNSELQLSQIKFK